jgi:signal transduction histidine kinase
MLAALPAAACLPSVQTLSEARFWPPGSGRPPPAPSTPGEPVHLPDLWHTSRPRAGGLGWYRLHLRLDAPSDAPCAVFLPSVNSNAVVFVNGTWIGQGGSLQEPVAHNFNRPLLFSFPGMLLVPGDNAIDVGLFAYPDWVGRLGPISVGSHRALAALHARTYAWQVGSARASTLLAVLMLLLAGALWIATGFESVYGFFVLASTAWALNSLNYWLRDIPFDHWTWDRLVNAALDQFPIWMTFWMHRVLGLERPRTERALFAASALALGVAFLTPQRFFVDAVLVVHGLAVGLGAYLAALVWAHRRRLSGVERIVYVGAGLVAVGAALHDMGMQMGLLSATASFLPAGLSLTLGAFGTTLLLRFVAALREARTLNEELERRVQAREAALASNYERLRQLERREILGRERERIVREMHDGLGGQLVSTIAMVESGRSAPAEVAAVLRDALAEMRLVIDSLDPELGDLGALLAQLRVRLAPVLEPAGVRFEWAVGDLPAMPDWGPDQLLDALRVVQEAITNAVRHGKARRIRLATERRADAQGRPGVAISVEDDGRGIAEHSREGRGFRHMRARAARLGGAVEISGAFPGTRVVLWAPLARA